MTVCCWTKRWRQLISITMCIICQISSAVLMCACVSWIVRVFVYFTVFQWIQMKVAYAMTFNMSVSVSVNCQIHTQSRIYRHTHIHNLYLSVEIRTSHFKLRQWYIFSPICVNNFLLLLCLIKNVPSMQTSNQIESNKKKHARNEHRNHNASSKEEEKKTNLLTFRAARHVKADTHSTYTHTPIHPYTHTRCTIHTVK